MAKFRLRLFPEFGRRREIIGEIHLELGTDDQVDTGYLLQLRGAGLRITTGYRDEGMRRVTQSLADGIAAIFFGILRYRAGVQDEQVRLLAELHQLIPPARQGIG
jgi:hypothetical protein